MLGMTGSGEFATSQFTTHTPDVERMIVAGQLYVGIIGSHSDKTLFNW